MRHTRARAQDPEAPQELNLAPIMNMVVILIPLLLLSAVFVSVSVINVSTPQLSPPPPSTTQVTDLPQALSVAVGRHGFYISSPQGAVTPQPECGGASVCLAEGDARALELELEHAQRYTAQGQQALAEQTLNHAIARYDWRALYNALMTQRAQNPHIKTLKISAEPRLPYAALIRLFDVARHELERDHYDSVASFDRAHLRQRSDGSKIELFAAPVLTITQ